MKKDFSYGVVPYRLSGGRREYLLIQHRAGHWAFPKGHAETGETPLQAAIRELAEETGLRALDIAPEPVLTERYVTVKKGVELDKTVTYFLGRVLKNEAVVMQEEEVSAYVWLSAEMAAKKITHPGCRGILAQAEEILRTRLDSSR